MHWCLHLGMQAWLKEPLATRLSEAQDRVGCLEGAIENLTLALARMRKDSARLSAQLAAAQAHAQEGGHQGIHAGQVALQGFLPNRVVEDPPYCRPGAAPAKRLPIYLFVAGVEGSGHHALNTVWHRLKTTLGVEVIVFDQQFHAFGIENHASYHYSRISLAEQAAAKRGLLANASSRDGAIVIDAQNSYPMGAYAGSLAHPDLGSLLALDGTLFDLRTIILYRRPTDAVLSAVRRFSSTKNSAYKSIHFQARAISESLVQLNNIAPTLPCGKWTLLVYEQLLLRPQEAAGPLARLLDVSKSKLEGAFDQIRAPASRKIPSPTDTQDRALLDEFFRQQEALWPLLAAGAASSLPAAPTS